MVLLSTTPGKLSAILIILIEMVLIPLNAFILSYVTGVVYNAAAIRGKSLRFNSSFHMFGWARKLGDGLPCAMLLLLAAFLKITVCGLPAIAETDFHAREIRTTEDFSSPAITARYDVLTSYGSFLDKDHFVKYRTVSSCTTQEKGVRTAFWAIQEKRTGAIKCLRGEDGFPLHKAAVYKSDEMNATVQGRFTQNQTARVTVRLFRYIEGWYPTVSSALGQDDLATEGGQVAHTRQSIGVFDMEAVGEDGILCKGSAVRLLSGESNRFAKVLGLCKNPATIQDVDELFQRVYLHYRVNRLEEADGMHGAETKYTVLNRTVYVNGSELGRVEANYSIITPERLSYFHINGSRVHMTDEKLRSLVTFMQPTISSMSGRAGPNLVHSWSVYGTVALSGQEARIEHTGEKQIYTELGVVATGTITLLVSIVMVCAVGTGMATYWLRQYRNSRNSLHTEEGLAAYLISAIGRRDVIQSRQRGDVFTVQRTDRVGEVSIAVGSCNLKIGQNEWFHTYV